MSCSDTKTERTDAVENQSSGKDVFQAATGNTNSKMDQNNAKSVSTNTQ